MSQRTVAVIVLALVFGMLAAFAVYQVAMKPPKTTTVEEEEVYIAKENIDPGSVIDMAQVERRKYPKDRLPVNAIKDEKDLKERMVKGLILQGDPIDERRLAKPNERGLTPMFEPGERAYACTVVDSASLGAGFILPQSFVDVLVTLRSNRGSDDPETRDAVTNVLLQHVQVLAIGQVIAPPKESKIDEKAGKFRTVTLRVKADQAALLQHASSMGVLHLILRHPKDESVEPVKPIGDRQVRIPGSEGPGTIEKTASNDQDPTAIQKQLDIKVAAMEKSLMKRFEEQYGTARKPTNVGPDGEEIKATPVRIMKGTLTDWVGISFDKPKTETPAPPK